MIWPPEALWSRIAALWAHANGPPGGECNNALAALRQIQADFDLGDAQLAYIAEYQALDPSSRVVRRERAENAFEIVLGIIDDVGLVIPFEHAVVAAAWALHAGVFFHFLHTPRLLVHSRGSGYGKTVLLTCLQALVARAEYMIAPTPAVLYHQLKTAPQTTFLIDDAEHSTLWNRQDVLVQIIDSGHRQGGQIPRVVNHKVVWYPTFAPLALGLIIDRDRRDRFPAQIATRSIALEMQQRFEGRDEIFPGDLRFVPVRTVIARWAETFQRPQTVDLSRELRGRCANNWYVLAAVADSLGYGATLRAAAREIERANFDPELRLYEDIYRVFEALGIDRIWTSELVQALREIEDAPWASLTNDVLYDRLYRRGVDFKTIWKIGPDGKRRSNKGFMRAQLEPVWCELLGHVGTQSSKIIRLPRHKRGTGGTHDE